MEQQDEIERDDDAGHGESGSKKNYRYAGGSGAMLLLGILILVLGNSPAAAGGAFVAAGLCALADAILDGVDKLARHMPWSNARAAAEEAFGTFDRR